MKTLERPTNGPTNGHTNGHARFDDADFGEVLRANDVPLETPVHDPLQSDGPIAKERKPLRNAAFQKLLEEIEQEELQPRAEHPAFPVQALPPELRDWAEAVAKQTQTAPEAAAMLALVASSAAIAGRVNILGMNQASHPLNLYVGVLTGGDRCDEVMSSAIEPLRELEFEDLKAAALEQAKDCVYKRDQPRALRKEEQRLAAAGDHQGLEWIEEKYGEVEACEVRPSPRRILDDVTARSLRFQLSELGRIACFSPTGDIFRQIAGRTCASKQRLLDTLDAGYAGRDFVVDGPRGKQIPVKSPAITIGTLVDSSLVSAIAGQRECHARSLLSRFLFVAPKSRVGARASSADPASEDDANRAAINRLLRGADEPLPPPSPEVAAYSEKIRQLAGRGSLSLILGPGVPEMLLEWEAEIERQLGPRGALAPIGEWARQLAGATLRIAGLLHVWKTGGPYVGPDTVAAAIEIARWLVPQAAHALEKLGAADDNCTERERALLRYARAVGENGCEFSPRDAWQHLRKTFLHVGALKRALAQLVRRGYLRVARAGERFPRAFALAALAVELVPLVFSEKRDKKKGKRAAQPLATPQNESTESTHVGESLRDSCGNGHPNDPGRATKKASPA